MTKGRRVVTWIALVLSLIAAAYAGISVMYFAWQNAAQPESWPAERAALWAYGSLGLMVAGVAVFIYCIVTLTKDER